MDEDDDEITFTNSHTNIQMLPLDSVSNQKSVTGTSSVTTPFDLSMSDDRHSINTLSHPQLMNDEEEFCMKGHEEIFIEQEWTFHEHLTPKILIHKAN